MQTPIGTTVSLEVEPLDTILKVKLAIQGKIGIPTKQQLLFLAGNGLLDDLQTLLNCNIWSGSTLTLVQVDANHILVQIETGTIIKLEYASHDTVDILKEKLQGRGLPLHCQCLTFNKEELKEGKSLSDYQIQGGALLHLSLHEIVPVLVPPPANSILTVRCRISDTVHKLKTKLPSQEYRLSLPGATLDNDKPLSSFLAQGSTILRLERTETLWDR